MKKLWVIGCLLFGYLLSACQSQHHDITVPQAPLTLYLHNKNQEIIGHALWIQDSFFLTPDHIFSTHKEIFWQNELLNVEFRDFEHDLLFFRLDLPMTFPHTLSSTPPELGKKLFFKDAEGSITKTFVMGLTESFHLPDNRETKHELLVTDGIVQPGQSGLPLFDDQGQVFGIIIGADRSSKKIYSLRSDIILRLLKEMID